MSDLGGWPGVLSTLIARKDLDPEVAEAAITEILEGSATPSQMTAFIVALRAKGETAAELAGMLRAVRAAGQRVDLPADVAARAIDIVGTGGDMSQSFNVSTLTAFVVAGAGVPVCKHGNRAASSKCGAADLLEELGVAAELDPIGVAECVAEANMGFCLAARFHPAFRYTAPSRREIGISTAFNLLGPMANPAAIGSMLVGVAVPWMMRPMIEALGSRGVRSAWVVHGHGGVDEITLAGPCRVLALSGGDITEFTVDASDVGLEHAPLEAIKGGDARENAEIARAILGGAQGPMRDTVVLNAAAALHLAGVAPDLRHGRMLAEQSIDSGAARGVLDRLVQSSNRAAKRLDQ
ncbi:MAG: anthranilate phosphoribosyltransferase [Actinomycetota bacterium]